MALSKEEYNERLAKLLNPEMEQSERTSLLDELRDDYGTFHSEHEKIVQEREQLQKTKDELIVSNSMLFRKIGIDGTGESKKEDESKNFSETITVSAIEKGL